MNEASNDNRTAPFSQLGLQNRDDFSLQDMGWLNKELQKRDVNIRTAEQCEQNRREILKSLQLGQDLLVFAYGDLIWNTGFQPAASRPMTVSGWRRSYCVDLLFGYGTPKKPGLAMALDKGGECTGVAHLIKASRIEADTRALWQREMSVPIYRPVFLDAIDNETQSQVLAFVIDQTSHLYSGSLEVAVQARRIATAEGPQGKNRDLLYHCALELKRRGVADSYIDDLAARTRALAQDAAV